MNNLNGWQVEVWVSKEKGTKFPMSLGHVGFNKEAALEYIDSLDKGYMINLSSGFEVYEIDKEQLEEF